MVNNAQVFPKDFPSDGVVPGVRNWRLPEVFHGGGVYVVPGAGAEGVFEREEEETGGITKTGNGHLRKLLTESSWHYARPNQVSKRLEQRREGVDEQTIRFVPVLPLRP
jgi:hypothetical protein